MAQIDAETAEDRAFNVRLRALRDSLAAGIPTLPRRRQAGRDPLTYCPGLITPSGPECSADFIGPLNPHVGAPLTSVRKPV